MDSFNYCENQKSHLVYSETQEEQDFINGKQFFKQDDYKYRLDNGLIILKTAGSRKVNTKFEFVISRTRAKMGS